MLCDRCGNQPATVHLTRIVNGERTDLHLCGQCAGEEGLAGVGAPAFHHLLGQLLQGELAGRPARPRLRCQACGLSFERFTRTGFLGCARCYEAFESQLEPILRRLHGQTQHAGKVPRGKGGQRLLREQIGELRQRLQEAVAAEEYERAAELRDRLQELVRQLGEGGG